MRRLRRIVQIDMSDRIGLNAMSDRALHVGTSRRSREPSMPIRWAAAFALTETCRPLSRNVFLHRELRIRYPDVAPRAGPRPPGGKAPKHLVQINKPEGAVQTPLSGFLSKIIA